MFDVLFFMTWILSLVCVAVLGFSIGYGRAVKDRAEFIDRAKGAAFEFLEALKCRKST